MILVEDRFARYIGPSEFRDMKEGDHPLVQLNWLAYLNVFDGLFGVENVEQNELHQELLRLFVGYCCVYERENSELCEFRYQGERL